MSTASRPLANLPAPVKRLLGYCCAVALFFGVSAALNPDKSLADARALSERTAPIRSGEQQPVTRPGTTRPLLGTLVGSPYHIWVYAGPHGPLYTVADRTGKILAQEVTAEEMYQQAPDAAVDKLRMQGLGEGTNIMVVPERRDLP